MDLPGIQLFPREQEVLTTSLAQKYLREPDTLVLCVVDATIPALDSSIALKMVRAADKLPNTILALTKSDLVRGETEITGRIFDRILRDSVDNSDNNHLEGLAACVAVSNRNHTDQHSLVGNEAEERSIFRAMLEDLPDFYQPDEVKQQLEENMTIRQLIVQLDKLFHSYIVQKWKPAALAYLAPLREEVFHISSCFHVYAEHCIFLLRLLPVWTVPNILVMFIVM